MMSGSDGSDVFLALGLPLFCLMAFLESNLNVEDE
jgi:hypothetical protein